MEYETFKPLIYVLSYILVLGGIPMLIARNKKRGILLPFCLGIFLGPIGWLIVAFMKPPLSPEEQEKLSQKLESQTTEGNENDWM